MRRPHLRAVEEAGEDVVERGLSERFSSARARRLFVDELARQAGFAPLAADPEYTKRKTGHARRRPVTHDGSMAHKREPLVAWADVVRGFDAALRPAGIDPADAATWPPAAVQTRISRLDRGKSSSPERQLADIIEWCLAWRFRPALHVGEETSGSIFRKRRRVLFEQFFEDIKNNRLVEPQTGEPIKHVLCWMYDRFTRDPDEGGKFIKAMLRHGIDLHETHWNAPPQELHQCQNEIRRAWIGASQEVENAREKIMSALRRKAVKGIPTFGVKELFGHVWYPDQDGMTGGYRVDPVIQKVIEKIVHRILEGASKYSIVCWLNENGYRNAAGNKWTMANLERLLRAPRLAGLIRLRIDSRRIYEDDYEGDLFPIELIYKEGEEPDPDFIPPIEPLISFPLWMRLQEELDSRATPRGPHAQHFASGRIDCWACDSGLVGSGGGNYHCPKRHLAGVIRDKGIQGQVAHDGLRHPAMKIVAADMFLEELLFAVVARDFDPNDGELSREVQARCESLDKRLIELDEDRANYAHLLKTRQIKRKEYDAWFAENTAETKRLRRDRKQLARVDRLRQLPRNKTLRDLWPAMPLEARREWLDTVFDKIVLHPAKGGILAVAERFEIIFANGYAPPAAELRELVEAIEKKVHDAHRRRSAHNRLTEKVEQHAWTLYEQRLAPSQIKRSLEAHPDVEISGHDWQLSNLVRVLRRLCEERGCAYEPQYLDQWKVPLETRELMIDLYRRLRGWASVAHELNDLGITRPGGGQWTSDYVRRTAIRHAEQQGVSLPKPKGSQRRGRPSYLSDAMRHTLWKMHYEGKMSYIAIARWLNERGIKTASGRSVWSKATVMYTVQQVERERKQNSKKRAA
jgi:DNA invertase Pin-like site-specific DNA recombinase